MVVTLAAAFIGVALVELYLFLTVSHYLGLGLTLLILLAASGAGALLVKREGTRAWHALRMAAGRGSLPGREIVDGALILAGGALLLTPGFLTDAIGLVLVLPVTRPLTRRLLLRWALRRQPITRPGHGRVIDVPPDGPPKP